MPDPSTGSAEESERRISPWWLLVFAMFVGAAVSGAVSLIASDDLSPIEWVGTTATIAAVVIAVGIYRLQERESSEAHSELMEQLEAQSELLEGYAEKAEGEEGETPAPDEPGGEAPATEERAGEAPGPQTPTEKPKRRPMDGVDLPISPLTPEQRAAVEARFGDGSIDVALDPTRGRSRGGARLVRLNDGRLVSVFNGGRRGGVRAREVGRPRGR